MGIQRIFCDSPKIRMTGGKQLSVYADQWRFRFTRGITYNINLNVSTGVLKSNEITKQLIDTLVSFEFLGIRIHVGVSDGGGDNNKLFCLLFDNKDTIEAWPEIRSISFINLANLSRRICISSCGTHYLKV